ncbi:MAG: HD domain-containing protein [Nitrospira sp.]|nr:HD domain-containing protein [Nitrospira sp.]
MKSKLSIIVMFFGWLIFTTYLVYASSQHGANTHQYLLSFNTPTDFFFRMVIFSALFGSHITAYLINERRKLLESSRESGEQLSNAARQWSATFNAMPYGVLLTDKESNIIRANQYIEAITGMSSEELLSGKKCYKTVCKIDKASEICDAKEGFFSNETSTYEHRDPLSSKIYSESVTPMFDSKGRLTSKIHVMRDVTDARAREEKLTKTKDAFFNMLKDLDSSFREQRDTHDSLVVAFSNIIDAKSSWTRGHSISTTKIAIAIADEIGLNSKEIETLRTASLLHDIGKIGTCDDILNKPGQLNDHEFKLIKEHTVKGEEMLKPIKGLESVLPIIRSHHEKLDGSGYPDGLKGDEISILAKILCVADSFDAMISDRPYRTPCGIQYAIKELTRCSGTQFDSAVVNAFLSVLKDDKLSKPSRPLIKKW